MVKIIYLSLCKELLCAVDIFYFALTAEDIYFALWRIFTLHCEEYLPWTVENIYLALWWTLNLCCRNHKITLHYWEHLPSAMETIYCTLHCGEHLCTLHCEKHLPCTIWTFNLLSVKLFPFFCNLSTCLGLLWSYLAHPTISAVLQSRNYLFRLRLRLSKSFRSGSGDSSDLGFEGTCFHSF